jgi:hypothetical protein
MEYLVVSIGLGLSFGSMVFVLILSARMATLEINLETTRQRLNKLEYMHP